MAYWVLYGWLVVIPFHHFVYFGFGVEERSIRDNSFVLQRPFRDVEPAADFGIVYSAAFGRRVEMAVEPSHRVGQSAGIGLQIRPCALFD